MIQLIALLWCDIVLSAILLPVNYNINTGIALEGCPANYSRHFRSSYRCDCEWTFMTGSGSHCDWEFLFYRRKGKMQSFMSVDITVVGYFSQEMLLCWQCFPAKCGLFSWFNFLQLSWSWVVCCSSVLGHRVCIFTHRPINSRTGVLMN